MRISDWSSDVCSSDLPDARDAQPHGVAQGDVDHRLGLHRIIIAIFGLGGGFEGAELRLGGDDIDHAGGRVAAEQRALRPAQRSEEHTSELQSLMRISYAVFCLKKKKK